MYEPLLMATTKQVWREKRPSCINARINLFTRYVLRNHDLCKREIKSYPQSHQSRACGVLAQIFAFSRTLKQVPEERSKSLYDSVDCL